MEQMFVVMRVRPWSELNFTSNHPMVAAMVEAAVTKAPIPGSTGFLATFDTYEAAEAFAEGRYKIFVAQKMESTE